MKTRKSRARSAAKRSTRRTTGGQRAARSSSGAGAKTARRKAPAKRAAGGSARRKRGASPRAKGAAPPSRRFEDRELELEAAAFRRLLRHFDERKDVQNIDLMNLAGFCRNCLSRWLVEAAQERGVELDLERAREKVYGMPYAEWKERYQPPATEEQLARFASAGAAK